jgi:hypothetical protein
VVAAVIERRHGDRESVPWPLAAVAIVIALGLIAILVGLRRPPGWPLPAANSPIRFTEAMVKRTGPGDPTQVLLTFKETGLQPGQSVSYHITGQARITYGCYSGSTHTAVGFQAQGPVDVAVTKVADGQGSVTASIPLPPPALSCYSPDRPSFVGANWNNFLVEDTSNGVRQPARGLLIGRL